jgi:hypothetical protein
MMEPAEMTGPAGDSERAEPGGVLPAASNELVDAVDEQLVRQLAGRAVSTGLSLTGEGGLLARLTKIVLEGALEGEMDAHLGCGRHDPAGRDGGNSRNGKRAKTVITDIGPVQVEVPRDRDASFEPKIVAKRQRRMAGVNDLVVSLAAKGLTTGEVAAQKWLIWAFPHSAGIQITRAQTRQGGASWRRGDQWIRSLSVLAIAQTS